MDRVRESVREAVRPLAHGWPCVDCVDIMAVCRLARVVREPSALPCKKITHEYSESL